MKEKEAKGPQMDIPLTESTQKTKSIRVENRKKRDSSRTEGDPPVRQKGEACVGYESGVRRRKNAKAGGDTDKQNGDRLQTNRDDKIQIGMTKSAETGCRMEILTKCKSGWVRLQTNRMETTP